MKKILAIITMLLFAVISRSQNRSHEVNAIIGDESFIQTFGIAPNPSTNEMLRIQTHLMFVEQALRNKNVTNLTKKQKRNREKVLTLLHEYWLNGLFPSNYDYPEVRKPCFIDRDGKICAVGYLIEKTAGVDVAKEVNALHQYDYIKDMKEEIVVSWAEENGLSLEECALIQPTYSGIPADKTVEVPIKESYGISSGFIGGTNIAINIFNLSNRNRERFKMALRIGLLSGTTQVVLGMANIRKDRMEYMINGYSTKTSYQPQKNLSYINIAAGAATLFSSAFNLYLKKNKKEEMRNNFSLYSYPDINQQVNMGISMIRKL
jgi:hypothetical protein